MKMTAKRIAELCGVSRGTVDRALNDRPGISAKTRAKVIRAIQDHGYRPHYVARSLVKGRTYSIGVVVFDLYNRFFSQMVNAIEYAATQLGYVISLSISDKDSEKEKRCISDLVGRQVDGIILMSVNKGAAFSRYLRRLGVPVVTVVNRISASWPFVGINDRQAMKDAVNHLAAKGYRQILYGCPPLFQHPEKNVYALQQRYLGYQEAFLANGLAGEPALLKTTDLSPGRSVPWDSGKNRPALLFSADIHALEAMNAVRDRGLRIPGDIGIMGFDNIDILKYVTPPLSTVAYHIDDIGRKAMYYLAAQLDGEESGWNESLIVEHSIVEGGSA